MGSDNSYDDNEDISCVLYFGNLHAFVQQKSLEDLCAYFGQVESAKVIKDKSSGSCAGYGFVRFEERSSAEAALQALNGKGYLGQELRVNWALPNNHKEDTSHHYHVFVGDLGSDVTDAALYNTFCIVGQCSDARVMWDHATGRSKGYGFVSFRSREDAEAAIDRMQGWQIGSRRIRVGWAQHKQDETTNPLEFEAVDRADPSNTNVYIGNISPETTEADLRTHFGVYGPLDEVKVHKKGGYGFVKFEQHRSAVQAIVGSHGRELHGRVLKCAWGKNISKPSVNTAALNHPTDLPDLSGNSLGQQDMHGQLFFANNMNILAQMMAIHQIQRDQAAANDLNQFAFMLSNPSNVESLPSTHSFTPSAIGGFSSMYPQY